MTELEKHVTDLETSKKLFEILRDRKTCFYWVWYEEETNYGELTGEKYWILVDSQNAQDTNCDKENQYENGKRIIYPCYLATELLEILPRKIIVNNAVYFLHIIFDNKELILSYTGWYTSRILAEGLGNGLVGVAADMIFNLHENKLYDFKKEVLND